MGLTDFDKRGAGLLQFDAISGGKSTSKKTDKKVQKSGKVDKMLTIGKNKYDLSKLMGGLSREEFDALPQFQRNLILNKQRQYGSQGNDISSVPSGSGKDFQQLSQPLESESGGTPEVLPIQTVAGDNTSSNILNQMATDKGDFSTDDDTADGTECTIECINMMKANSVRLIKF